jgi:hypothetical protein
MLLPIPGSQRNAVDCEIEVAGRAAPVIPNFMFSSVAVDELVEWSPGRNRLFEGSAQMPISSRSSIPSFTLRP